MKTKEEILNIYNKKGLDFFIIVNYDKDGICEPYKIKLRDISELILNKELDGYYYFKNISKSTALTPRGEANFEILKELKKYYRRLKIELIRNNVGTRS